MKRRTMLGLGVLGGASIATGFVLMNRPRARESGPAPDIQRFELTLKIPSVLEPTTQTETQDEYEIVQREAEHEILPGHTTEVWGYQGCWPGPTIRVKQNRTA